MKNKIYKKHFGKITQFFTSLFNNAVARNIYYEKLKEITVTLYRWENLPPEIDARFLELTLHDFGAVCFFRDEVLNKFMVMKTTRGGTWDIYNNPIRRHVFANNGFEDTLFPHNSVLIYNNVLRGTSEAETLYYADKLGFYDRIIDLNVNAQKTPLLITCPENKRLSLKNLYMKYEGNEPVIFADDSIVPDSIKVMKTDAPFVADQIYEMKVKYWNEFLTFKGVSNVNIEGRERMTNDEVYRQLGGSLACRGSGMLMRRQAAQQINEMFGLNIKVVFNEEYQLIEDRTDPIKNQLDLAQVEGVNVNE